MLVSALRRLPLRQQLTTRSHLLPALTARRSFASKHEQEEGREKDFVARQERDLLKKMQEKMAANAKSAGASSGAKKSDDERAADLIVEAFDAALSSSGGSHLSASDKSNLHKEMLQKYKSLKK